MAESERAWYQKGEVVFVLFLLTIGLGIPLGLRIYREWQFQQLAVVTPRMTGRIEQSLFGAPSLILKVWHQHPGHLRNGKLALLVADKQTPLAEADSREHSFEIWEPNESHAVTFEFPLTEFDPSEEIKVWTILEGEGIRYYVRPDTWQGSGWKENAEPSGK